MGEGQWRQGKADMSELEMLGSPWGSQGSGRLLCHGQETKSLLAGLALAWGCEQWGAALAGKRLRAESAAFTQPEEALCF